MLRALSLFCLVAVSTQAFAQEFQPGAEHKKLADLEGTWNLKIKSDGGDSTGKSVFKLECGGLWLTSDFQSDFGGVKFQGKGLDGYDPAKKKYVSVWVDSLSPAPMVFEGDYDKEGKTLTMTCSAPLPGSNQPAQWRSVTKIVDKDKHTFEMYLKPEGAPEQKMMTVEYTRAK
jgi:hypothetical protein